MRRIVDELTQPPDHLALDEAMLVAADEGESSESIRIWEFRQVVAVAGRSTRVEDEMNVAFCGAQGIPILRRCTGGASVVGGAGCLMYSVVLSLEQEPALRKIDVAHAYVMGRVLRAVQNQVAEAELSGTCDITWRGRKCSGNALRIARHHLLYHGTILHDFDLPLIGRCLRLPPRQPEYRAGRGHDDFLTNLAIDVNRFVDDLCEIFSVTSRANAGLFAARIRSLRQQRYDSRSWNFRH